MDIATRKEAENLKATVLASPEKCTVFVAGKYSHFFRSVPQDGRTYIVQELRRPWICHVTYPNGDYKRIDTGTASRKGLRGAVGNLPLTVARGRNGRSAARLAEVDASYKSPTDRPELCLIGLNRVMQITGFKKTFIYDQLALGFPAPVRLGDSRRAAARWIEAEVFQWVRQLADKRVAKVSSV